MSRIMSGWAHAKHDFKSAKTFEEYRDKIAGCATRMIAGYECSGTSWERIHSVTTLLDTAVDRLHEGFAFVGIAEEWELSMCLFFRMYGGCHKRAFLNTRPGSQMGTRPPTADLLNWTDPWDEPLYAHAVAIYRSLKDQYNISNFTCRTQVCKEWPFPFMDNFTKLPSLGKKR